MIGVEKNLSEITTEHLNIFTKTQSQHYLNYSGKTKFSSLEEEYEWSKTQSKKCNTCGKTLALTEFRVNTSGAQPFNKDGIRYRRGNCLQCGKNQNIGKNNAIKKAKDNGILTKAPKGTTCEICGRSGVIVFDHDHKTEEFRGFICDPCNRSIGILSVSSGGSDIGGLITTLNYMLKYNNIKDIDGNIINKILFTDNTLTINKKRG